MPGGLNALGLWSAEPALSLPKGALACAWSWFLRRESFIRSREHLHPVARSARRGPPAAALFELQRACRDFRQGGLHICSFQGRFGGSHSKVGVLAAETMNSSRSTTSECQSQHSGSQKLTGEQDVTYCKYAT